MENQTADIQIESSASHVAMTRMAGRDIAIEIHGGIMVGAGEMAKLDRVRDDIGATMSNDRCRIRGAKKRITQSGFVMAPGARRGKK